MLATATSHADDKVEAARLFELGKRHYNLNEHDEAIAQFKAAYKRFPDAVYLFNIAQAYRLKGTDWCGLAAQFYGTYQREEQDKKLRDSVKKRREEMEACAKKHPQKTEPPPPPPPTNGTGFTEPPLTVDQPVTPTAPPPATPTSPPVAPMPEPEADPNSARRRLSKALMIGGGVTVALGVIWILDGVDAQRSLKECRGLDAPDDCFDDFGFFNDRKIEKLEARQSAGFYGGPTTIVVGIGLLLGGAYMYRHSKKTDRPKVTLVPTRSGAAFVGSF
jgi:hypothetical protein